MQDYHVHIGYGNSRHQNRSEKYSNTIYDNGYNNLLQYEGSSITLLRDGGDKNMVAHGLRGEAQERNITLLSSGRALVKAGRYGKHLGLPIETSGELRRELEFLAAAEVDQFKLILSGLVDVTGAPQDEQPNFSEGELDVIRRFTLTEGKPLMVHVNFPRCIEMTIDAGVDTIEHGYFMTEPLLKKMKAKDIAWTPTLAPFANAITYGTWIEGWDRAIVDNVVANHRAMIRCAVNLGVRVLIGSDTGSSIVPHGRGTIDEHHLLQELGVE